ncbi:MAG: N-acetyltransferase [Epsilonproteobacteria bacterium]|nr:N-acetyltransferase [Campylobacterota bacterium]
MVKFVKANLSDIADMQNIVGDSVEDGAILRRSDDEVATNIRSYTLAKSGDEIIGYLALHIHSLRLAEIRSLIVSERYRGDRIGSRLVKIALQEAKELGVKEVLVLTYLPHFFKKLGFIEIPKETIPEHKIWTDCIKCIHFPVCNEISLIYKEE